MDTRFDGVLKIPKKTYFSPKKHFKKFKKLCYFPLLNCKKKFGTCHFEGNLLYFLNPQLPRRVVFKFRTKFFILKFVFFVNLQGYFLECNNALQSRADNYKKMISNNKGFAYTHHELPRFYEKRSFKKLVVPRQTRTSLEGDERKFPGKKSREIDNFWTSRFPGNLVETPGKF